MSVFPDDIVKLKTDVADSSHPLGRVCCVESDEVGEAHVYWMRAAGDGVMEPIAALEVVDRALLHGDTVRRLDSAATTSARSGMVLSSRIRARVRKAPVDSPPDLDEAVLPPGGLVDTRKLRHLQPFRTGTFVVRDGWLGRVDAWVDDLTVRFPDGKRCRLYGATTEDVLPVG